MRTLSKINGLLLVLAVGLSFALNAQAQQDRGEGSVVADPDYFCQESSADPGCDESAQCEAAVCAVDSFCCDVAWDSFCVEAAQEFEACLISREPRATFQVNKTFDDGNTAEVEVTLSCNTGLPLEQSDDISEGDGVNFVVVDFNDGEMDCTVTETAGADGYSVSYFDGTSTSEENCSFEDVLWGSAFSCRVDNTLEEVEVEVTKEWIDENPQFNPFNFARADYSCEDAQGTDPSGSLTFSDDDSNFEETATFSVFPHWNGDTTCDVDEMVVESGIEADDSDCQNLSVTPGNGASCTIVNTRLFEGIPTLSQYGMGILALLMLGLGLVTYRRFV